MLKGFADIGDLDEDDRIDIIGNYIMDAPKSSADKPIIVAVVLEDDPEKVKRYIKKLKDKFPKVRVIKKSKGPVSGTMILVLGEPLR